MTNKREISNADWEKIHDALENQGVSAEPPAGIDEDARALLEDIKVIRSGAKQLEGWEEVDVKGDWQLVKKRLDLPDTRSKVRRFPVKLLFRSAAAILLPVVLVASVFFYLRKPGNLQSGKPSVPGAQTGNGISLTLSNGEKKVIEYGNELRQTADALLVKNKDGEWQPIADRAVLPEGMLLLEAPAGHTAALILEDGSSIWLNASSSIRYPSRFTGSREVTMTGEACYEIAGNADVPFIVNAGAQKIQVLGTLFNVNAYSNRVQTTLASGKISVSTGDNPARILLPNQQAVSEADGKSFLVTNADPAIALAWHSGNIAFNDIPLRELLEQLGRIYNYRIQYADGNRYDSLHYNVPVMPRPASIGPMLELIKTTTPGDIQFKIDSTAYVLTVK